MKTVKPEENKTNIADVGRRSSIEMMVSGREGGTKSSCGTDIYTTHEGMYTEGKGKVGGFWRRKVISLDCILNKIARNDRRARRVRVI
eukprot:6182233-Pleurochrysis_carterae.AAC.5